MTKLKKTLLKTILAVAVLGGASMAYFAVKPDVSPTAVLESVETKTAVVANAVGEKTDVVRKAWQRFDLESKVKTVQDKSRPAGNKLRSKLGQHSVPGQKAAIWGERNMSLPAILLILVFGGVFMLMKTSGPNSMLGGRH